MFDSDKFILLIFEAQIKLKSQIKSNKVIKLLLNKITKLVMFRRMLGNNKIITKPNKIRKKILKKSKKIKRITNQTKDK